MADTFESLPYAVGANQLLRALYDYVVEHPGSYASYDRLVDEGAVAPGFRWVKRFVEDMIKQGHIVAAKSFDPEGAWGMQIAPSGQTYVERELEANPAWGDKPLAIESGSYGSGGFGTGGFGGDSIATGTHVTEDTINTSSEPTAGTAFGVIDAVSSHEATSPAITADASSQTVDASEWTGVQSRAVRLAVLCDLIPLAQNAIHEMIAQLSQLGDNGGPLLDENEEAIKALRKLHAALGEVLSAIDGDRFNDDFGEGLTVEVIRYGKRVYESVRSDPMRYSVAALIFGILTACGLGSGAGVAAGAALQIKKSS